MWNPRVFCPGTVLPTCLLPWGISALTWFPTIREAHLGGEAALTSPMRQTTETQSFTQKWECLNSGRVIPRSVCWFNQEELLRSGGKAVQGHLSGNCCSRWRGQRMRKVDREAQLTGCCCFGIDPFSCTSVFAQRWVCLAARAWGSATFLGDAHCCV